MSEKGKIKLLKYRHLIIAISIIIIVIILDIIFENYSKRVIENVNGKIEKIYNEFENSDDNYDAEQLKKLSKEAKKEWEKKEGILTCFIEHEEVEKINVKLNMLKVEIKNELWGDAKSTTAETKLLVKYLNDKYKLSLQNIF